jgi:transposase
MTVVEEAKQIRIEVARLRPGRGRKYEVGLRRRIMAWLERAKQSGMLEVDCSRALGVPQHRFEMWRKYDARDAVRHEAQGHAETAVALVPVQTPSTIQVTLGVTVTSPRGWRVEGLTLEQASALLREFE